MSKFGRSWHAALLLLASTLLFFLSASPASARCEDNGGVGLLAVTENNTSTATAFWTGYWGTCDHDHFNVAWAGGGGRVQRELPISAKQSSLSGLRRGTVYTVSVQGCASHFLASSTCGPWQSIKFVSCGTRGLPCGHPRLDAPPPMKIVSGAGLCLDVHAPDQFNNGARVQAWACNGSAQQTWVVDKAGAVISLAGKCLDVHAPDMLVNGGRVQVWDCNGQPQQRWFHDTFREQSPTPGGNMQTDPIRNAGGKCLDVHAPDQFKNGARVQVWTCNDTKQQHWRIVAL